MPRTVSTICPIAAGADVRTKHRHERAVQLAFVNDVENFLSFAAKTIKTGYNQRIVGAEELDNRC